jgi:hypothetical protein
MNRACSTNREKLDAYRTLVESQKERDHKEDQDVDGWITLKCILDRTGWYGLD